MCALKILKKPLWLSSLQAGVSEEAVPVGLFVEHLLPSLLSLVVDPVPHPRVLLAKTLWQTLLEKGVWALLASP